MDNISCEIILGGVSSIFGLEEIKNMIEEKGLSVCFLETEYMIGKNPMNNTNIKICDEANIEEKSIFIPLNEYWLSYGHKKKIDRISDRAYKSSRSKKFFSNLLNSNNIDCCKTISLEEAQRRIGQGGKVLIKPDSYYSGHGVRIVEKRNEDKLDQYLYEANIITDDAKRVLMIEKGFAEMWDYIEGEEYSADVLVLDGKIDILRLCRKKIVIIDDMPCVIAYVTESITSKVQDIIQGWVDLLFDKDNISFCQFDFIKNANTNKFVPIDFSCRVGGGMTDMIKCYEHNIYQEALEKIITKHKIIKNPAAGIYQFNILPIKCGELYSNAYNIATRTVKKYKKEKSIIDRIGGSSNDRLGCVVGDNYSDNMFDELFCNLLIGEGYIK